MSHLDATAKLTLELNRNDCTLVKVSNKPSPSALTAAVPEIREIEKVRAHDITWASWTRGITGQLVHFQPIRKFHTIATPSHRSCVYRQLRRLHMQPSKNCFFFKGLLL